MFDYCLYHCRFAQLVYLVMIRKTKNIPYLRRDTTLLRLIHTLLVSAPLSILHLYVLLQYVSDCLAPDTTCQIFNYPSIYAAFGSSLATLLYSVLAFATNDRLSGKNRRVIFPAHLMQILWYVCVLVSRMLAITLFAYAYDYYIFVFLGGHWLVMFLFLLVQKTTFCADVIRETDSNVTIKRRWCLEIPFDFVAATMYIFAFFGFRRGNTRYWAAFYHILTYAEIATMGALFFIKFSSTNHLFVFSLTSLTISAGLYPVGLLFMLSYYLFFHPKKTENWYWMGFPKSAAGPRRESRNIGNRGFRNRTPEGRVDISGPTLVAHNGFIPRTMLPDDVPSSPGHEGMMSTNPADIITQSQRSSEQREEWVVPRSTSTGTGHEFVSSLTMVSPNSAGQSTIVTSDAPLYVGHSLVGPPSDFDTGVSSGVLHMPQGEIKGDTVIDTPLFGNTPDPIQQLRLKVDTSEPGTLRSLTDTVDTGIDLGADTPLTQDPQDNNDFINCAEFYGNKNRVDMNLGLDIDLPQFSDIPAKRNSFLAKKSPLETHYFPSSESHDSLTPTLPAPSWGYRSSGSSKPLFGQNSSGESGEVYQSKTKSSVASGGQHHVLPLAVSTPERTRRTAPRSPKGARAFTISLGEERKSPVLTRNRATYSNHKTAEPYQHHPPTRPRAPRSPKGARRLLITQPTTTKPRPDPIELSTNRHSFVNPKSPERLPRSVLNYQRQSTTGSVSAKTPDGRRRNNAKPQLVQKSHSVHVTTRSPERHSRGATGYRPENSQQRHSQYIQQQQEQRSRWDKWAAEQEEKRRKASSEVKPKVVITQSHPSKQQTANIPRNMSVEFDHLEPSNEQNSTDGASSINQSASVAPQGYPRAPQGARGSDVPRLGWSPSRSDRISASPQRSIHSANAPLLPQNSSNLSASYQDGHRMSSHISGGDYNKFYAPTRSMHQSVV